MIYDYYIQEELIIEYKNKNDVHCKISTNINIKKKYIKKNLNPNKIENVINEKEYETKLNCEINENTYTTIIFDNGLWIDNINKKKYKKQLMKTFSEIYEIIKIYIKNTAINLK